MSLVDSKIFPLVRPYLRVEVYTRDGGAANPRVRIEVRGAPPVVVACLLAHTEPCVACGAKMHPFRARKAPAKRGTATGLYFAAACPLSCNIGCSRGEAAKLEYLAIRSAAA